MKAVAFLFTVSDFQKNSAGEAHERIETAQANMAAMRDLLTEPDILGADIVAKENPTRGQMLDAISSYKHRRDYHDVALLYVCTHGHIADGEFCITTHDTVKGQEGIDPLRFDTVMKIFKGVQARNHVVIVDACYSGTLVTHSLANDSRFEDLAEKTAKAIDNSAQLQNVKALEAGKSTEDAGRTGGFVLCSSSGDKTSEMYSHDREHTAFTGALLNAIKSAGVEGEPERRVTMKEIVKRTKQIIEPPAPQPCEKDVNGFEREPFLGNYKAMIAKRAKKTHAEEIAELERAKVELQQEIVTANEKIARLTVEAEQNRVSNDEDELARKDGKIATLELALAAVEQELLATKTEFESATSDTSQNKEKSDDALGFFSFKRILHPYYKFQNWLDSEPSSPPRDEVLNTIHRMVNGFALFLGVYLVAILVYFDATRRPERTLDQRTEAVSADPDGSLTFNRDADTVRSPDFFELLTDMPLAVTVSSLGVISLLYFSYSYKFRGTFTTLYDLCEDHRSGTMILDRANGSEMAFLKRRKVAVFGYYLDQGRALLFGATMTLAVPLALAFATPRSGTWYGNAAQIQDQNAPMVEEIVPMPQEGVNDDTDRLERIDPLQDENGLVEPVIPTPKQDENRLETPVIIPVPTNELDPNEFTGPEQDYDGSDNAISPPLKAAPGPFDPPQ